MRNPRIISHTDLQNASAIKSHIVELYGDYSRTKNPVILSFITAWTNKYELKLIEENERRN